VFDWEVRRGDPVKLAAALLAGGESRRMGRDKALIEVAGKPLWQKQLDLLHQLEPAETFVSARNDPSWRPADVNFVEDSEPSRGPLSGVAACLARMQSDHLLVLAVDMAFMTVACLREICRQVGVGYGTIPTIESRAEPLAAAYPAGSLAEFLAALGGHDFSLQPIARKLITAGKLRPLAIKPEQIQFYRSLNEPADLEDIRAAGV
jgi:molybdenum cofactor guanylyltransferase